jgi:hypothetical protein
MSRILAGALVAAAALAGTIFWEVQDPAAPELAATAGRTPLTSTVRVAAGLDTSDVMQGWASTALARPLFREDRRPVKTADVAGPRGEGPVRLTGVITGESGNRAIFMSGENAKPIVAQVGAHVGDFVVRSIEAGHVEVEADGMIRTMNPAFSEVAKQPRP